MSPARQIKKVTATKEKVMVMHSCTQGDTIKHLLENSNKLSIIITGNGDPEKGLCQQVALGAERQLAIREKLIEIHDSLNRYHTELQETKKMAETVMDALSLYKTETANLEKGRENERVARQVIFNREANIVSNIILFLGLAVSIWIGVKDNKKTQELTKKVDDFGTPVIVNPRGQVTPLPTGDSLKFYRNGEFKNGIRDSDDIQAR